MTDMMTGWRLSWLGPDGWLYPPFRDVDTALPRRAVARCLTNPRHTVPEPDCLCGYYICGTIAALRPLALGLRTMNGQAAAAGLTAVLHTVELETPLRSDHLATTPFGGFMWAAMLTWAKAAGSRQFDGAVIEGEGTYRGSAVTITGRFIVPAVPGIARGAVTLAARRYRVRVEHHDGDIADVVEALTTEGIPA